MGCIAHTHTHNLVCANSSSRDRDTAAFSTRRLAALIQRQGTLPLSGQALLCSGKTSASSLHWACTRTPVIRRKQTCATILPPAPRNGPCPTIDPAPPTPSTTSNDNASPSRPLPAHNPSAI